MMYRLSAEMMFFAVAQNDVARYACNDVMFALMCPQAHIIATGNIISEATSFARKGKHHSKKISQVFRLGNFFGCGGGT